MLKALVAMWCAQLHRSRRLAEAENDYQTRLDLGLDRNRTKRRRLRYSPAGSLEVQGAPFNQESRSQAPTLSPQAQHLDDVEPEINSEHNLGPAKASPSAPSEDTPQHVHRRPTPFYQTKRHSETPFSELYSAQSVSDVDDSLSVQDRSTIAYRGRLNATSPADSSKRKGTPEVSASWLLEDITVGQDESLLEGTIVGTSLSYQALDR